MVTFVFTRFFPPLSRPPSRGGTIRSVQARATCSSHMGFVFPSRAFVVAGLKVHQRTGVLDIVFDRGMGAERGSGQRAYRSFPAGVVVMVDCLRLASVTTGNTNGKQRSTFYFQRELKGGGRVV